MPKVQISWLYDSASSLPNRDQNGRAKRAPYGGTQRQRISSQCYKSALRSATYLVKSSENGDVQADNLIDLATRYDLEMSVRSRAIFSRLVRERLIELGMDEETSAIWVEEGKAIFGKSKGQDEKSKKGEKTEDADNDEAQVDDVTTDDGDVGAEKNKPGFTKQPLVLGRKEIEGITAVFMALHQAGMSPKEAVTRITGKNNSKDEVSEAIETFRSICGMEGGNQSNLERGSKAGIDGVLFGRFATSDFVANVDSSVHVAHLLGVTPMAAVSDYFTVQDSLLKGIESGGSHQNTVELASALFLGTIVIDLGQLINNLGGYIEGDEVNNDRLTKTVAEIVAWLVRAIHTVNPAAKLGSTAPYGNVVESVVEIGRRMPHQHILAFQNAIRPESLGDTDLASEASRRLLAQVKETGRKFGAQKHVMNLGAIETDEVPAYELLAEQARLAVLAELTR